MTQESIKSDFEHMEMMDGTTGAWVQFRETATQGSVRVMLSRLRHASAVRHPVSDAHGGEYPGGIPCESCGGLFREGEYAYRRLDTFADVLDMRMGEQCERCFTRQHPVDRVVGGCCGWSRPPHMRTAVPGLVRCKLESRHDGTHFAGIDPASGEAIRWAPITTAAV